jgi:hypothetical protein
VAPRERAAAFSLAGLFVLAGAACAALVSGVVGEVLTIVLISAGLAGALLLVFLEIGLSEERDNAREEERRRRRVLRGLEARRGAPWRRRRRPP